MLRFNTSARLTTHSWGWFERGWSSAAPGGICELLLRPACLRILLQCISLFKLCHLLCPVAHNFPFASVSLVQLCSRLQTRVWCQRPWAHREIEGGGLLMQAWSHAVMLKQEKHMPDWCGGQLLGGVPDPKMFTHCSHSSVTCNPPPPGGPGTYRLFLWDEGWNVPFSSPPALRFHPLLCNKGFTTSRATCSILLAGTVRTQNKLMSRT